MPDFGVYIKVQGPKGDVEYRSLSRQLVLFCVERRKAWRMLQSKAGIENREYKAQRSILADVDAGKLSKEELFARAEELMRERLKVPAAGAGAGCAQAGNPDAADTDRSACCGPALSRQACRSAIVSQGRWRMAAGSGPVSAIIVICITSALAVREGRSALQAARVRAASCSNRELIRSDSALRLDVFGYVESWIRHPRLIPCPNSSTR